MPDTNISIEVDVDERAADRWQRIVGEGATDAVDQITTLAEGAMKEEAPEGAGIPRVNMRTTIKSTTKSQDPYRVEVQPHKRTDDGWLLHHAIVGNPSAPTYDTSPPPLEPILQWAKAKTTPGEGETIRDVAQNIRWSIFHDGHETLPNEFIDRSVKKWNSQVDQIASDAVEDAFGGGG